MTLDDINLPLDLSLALDLMDHNIFFSCIEVMWC